MENQSESNSNNMTWKEFVEIYAPIKNPFDANTDCDGHVFSFANHAEDPDWPQMLYVQDHFKYAPETIWTVVDDNDGWYGIISGCHYINRMGYIITQVGRSRNAGEIIVTLRDDALEHKGEVECEECGEWYKSELAVNGVCPHCGYSPVHGDG